MLGLGATTAQAKPGAPSRASCVTHAHVRHTAIVDSIAAGEYIMVSIRADKGVNLTWTTVGPGDRHRGKAIRGGRNANVLFKSRADNFQLWIYMNGPGGACTAHLATWVHYVS